MAGPENLGFGLHEQTSPCRPCQIAHKCYNLQTVSNDTAYSLSCKVDPSPLIDEAVRLCPLSLHESQAKSIAMP
jgi:hypothetical protein